VSSAKDKPAAGSPDRSGATCAIHVVAALIWHPHNSNTFLISKRLKGKHLEYYWEFPGGKKKAGETPLLALQRELMEEINIMPLDARPYMQVRHSYDDRDILLDVWEVNSFKGIVKALEGQEISWIAISELDQFRFPEADIVVLETIVNNA
jgi:8-oxo-dGTP diphosphatase